MQFLRSVHCNFLIFFAINVGIGAYFAYYKYMSLNKENVSKYYDYVCY